ncbi:hypothetical protein BCR37DRAFT_386829 [Protomyces lactucae-debilis]|uniref:Peptidase S1 domain-containing protein n=1 Tax=Protomyces lactucae-debilis TaxID=2754530 RepID=A0A1Y2FKV6_PROLT|nr:uncharacterized protein BCR37DRAFT_386829 [Protomyces lactucae-debilis]ORY83836.1 hypothetical protein BCR37DRAFT_386829 [Protomyces lactucae-debilis]
MLLRYCLFIGTLGLSISAKPESIHIKLTDEYIQELEEFWTADTRQAARNNSFQNHGGNDSEVDIPAGHLERRNPQTYSRDRSPRTLKAGVERIPGQLWVGWLYFLADVDGKSQTRACIASIVASPSGSVIATTAECVFDRSTWKSYYKFAFYPGHTDDMWPVPTIFYHWQYKDKKGREAYSYKWNVAFAKLGKRYDKMLAETYKNLALPQPSFKGPFLADKSDMVQFWKPAGPPVVSSKQWESGPSSLLRCTFRTDSLDHERDELAHIYWIPWYRAFGVCSVKHNDVGSPVTYQYSSSPDSLVQIGTLMTGHEWPYETDFFVWWDSDAQALFYLADQAKPAD